MSVETDRDTFRATVAEIDELKSAGDSDGANVLTAEIEKLAGGHSERGELGTFLTPLLDAGEAAEVRYSASTIALGAGLTDLAIPVLEELSQGRGLTATTAGMVLRHWKRQNA